MPNCRFSCGTVACALLVLSCASVAMADPNIVIKQAPPLPPPTGDVVYVSTMSQLQSQIDNAPSGRTIMVNPGQYYTTRNLAPKAGVTIRGATGNRDDVVLWGAGMHNTSAKRHVFWLRYSDITIADLTIRDAYYHGIQIAAEYQTDRIHLYNVKILDCGERFIKGSSNHNPSYSPDDVVIEYCWLEQIQDFITRPDNSVDPDNYIGGIDAMWCNRWIIRDCVFKNIRGLTGGARGGIFLWHNCQDIVVERNLVIGCDRGIAIGNPSGPNVGTYHSINGIVRNNCVVRGADIGVEFCKTNNLNVYNNTIYSDNPNYSRTVHVYGSVTTGLKLHYNIIRGQIFNNGASGTTTGSLVGSTPQATWFVEPLVGDVRLTASATAAINQGVVLAEVTDDYFGLPRDSQPDVGAHEYIAPAGPRITAVTPALATVQSKNAPLQQMTITFDKDVTISAGHVGVVGVNTGLHNDFIFAYSSASRTVTLTWAQPLPNDTYVINVSAAVTAGGVALDGECDLYSPVLPTGNGTAGGAFQGLVYRLAGDVDGDRSVNVFDIFGLAECWNSQAGDPAYDPAADLDEDGQVNVFDIFVIAENWNASIPAGL